MKRFCFVVVALVMSGCADRHEEISAIRLQRIKILEENLGILRSTILDQEIHIGKLEIIADERKVMVESCLEDRAKDMRDVLENLKQMAKE